MAASSSTDWIGLFVPNSERSEKTNKSKVALSAEAPCEWCLAYMLAVTTDEFITLPGNTHSGGAATRSEGLSKIHTEMLGWGRARSQTKENTKPSGHP